LIILTLTSYSDKYPEPIWYEIEFNDGVTHLWSREIMYDYNGIVQETSDIINNKYKGESIERINYKTIRLTYLLSRIKRKEKQRELTNI
jgi:hypothetical protein